MGQFIHEDLDVRDWLPISASINNIKAQGNGGCLHIITGWQALGLTEAFTYLKANAAFSL